MLVVIVPIFVLLLAIGVYRFCRFAGDRIAVGDQLATNALGTSADRSTSGVGLTPGRSRVKCPFCDWATPNDLNVVEQMSAHTTDRHLPTNHLTEGTTE